MEGAIVLTQLIPIPLGFVNAFLLKSEFGAVLVDTGTPGSWNALKKGILAAGCAVEDIKLVLLTHGDFDHAGCGKRLKDGYGLPIAIHEADVPMVRDGATLRRTVTNGLMKLFFSLRGPKAAQLGTHSFVPDMLLHDGQTLSEYGVDATVYHVPGHTKGSVVVLTAAGELIAGDTSVNGSRPTVWLVEDFDELEHSLARLGTLGAHTAYPGHGKPFSAELLPAIRQEVRRRYSSAGVD